MAKPAAAMETAVETAARVVRVAAMFTGIKDSLASTAAKSLLASRLDRYARLTELKIRSREKSIAAELVLEGEEVPLSIAIGSYRLTGKSGDYALVVEEVSASRPWLQNLLQDLLVEKPLAIPPVVLIALGKPEEEPKTAKETAEPAAAKA